MPYWRAGFETFKYHLTQYRNYIEGLKKMDEKTGRRTGKELGRRRQSYAGKISGGRQRYRRCFFEGLTPARIPFVLAAREAYEQPAAFCVELGGPWGFYEKFRRAHGLNKLPKPSEPEIAIKRGTILTLPLDLHNRTDAAKAMTISVKLPDGWTTQSGVSTIHLDPQSDYYWQVLLESPKAETKAPQGIECRAEADGKTLALIRISVHLRNGGLPQN